MKHFPAPIESADNAARLVIGGEQIDMRTREARRFKAILRDLAEQMDREPTASERLQLMSAATLAMCIERDTLAMLRGEVVEQEPNAPECRGPAGLLNQSGARHEIAGHQP
jgi:hypothetical protein